MYYNHHIPKKEHLQKNNVHHNFVFGSRTLFDPKNRQIITQAVPEFVQII